MGIDAKAYILYGYRKPLSIDEDVLDNYEELCVFEWQEKQYLFACESYQSFDWDYEAQSLDPRQMYSDEENNSYFRSVRKFLADENEDYKDSDIGWFVLCDIL